MNLPAAFFIGALNLDLPKQNRPLSRLAGLLFSDTLLIIGLGLAVLLALAIPIYIWSKWRRNRRKHITGGERVYRSGQSEQPTDSEVDPENADRDPTEHSHSHHHHHGRRRYKYRVRRRSHRSRNPTLSETGGLPPARTQEPSKPC